MTRTIEEFKQLVDAEEFLNFFNLPYDQEIVNVNRLHILKKFSQYIREIDDNSADINSADLLNKYAEAMQKAYQVFIESTPQEQKLFKVFNDKQKNVVKLTEITSD